MNFKHCLAFELDQYAIHDGAVLDFQPRARLMDCDMCAVAPFAARHVQQNPDQLATPGLRSCVPSGSRPGLIFLSLTDRSCAVPPDELDFLPGDFSDRLQQRLMQTL